MKKRKTLYLLIILILLIGGSSLVYRHFENRVTLPQVEQQTKSTDKSDENNVQNIKDEKYDLTFLDDDFQEQTLSSFIGKPIILNFWASWCPPCQHEMPFFQEIYNEYPDIQVLLINQTDGTRENRRTARDFMMQNGYTMPLYYDKTTESLKKYGLSALPMTYFINAEGDIIGSVKGGITEETLQQYAKKLTE